MPIEPIFEDKTLWMIFRETLPMGWGIVAAAVFLFARWLHIKHWIVGFHDETLEVLADEAVVVTVTEVKSPRDLLLRMAAELGED